MAKNKAAKMGRPVGPDGPVVVVATSIPQTLAQQLGVYADANGLTRSAVVVEALKGYFARKKR
jgi:hypothetical protein